jgi:crossover junction endodeoxyribonuclease RuvC
MIVIGIDPGATGAIAGIHSTKGLLEVWDMPAMEISGSRSSQRVSGAQVREIFGVLRDMEPGGQVVIYMEDVHSMPKQGVVSTFTFGVNTGIVLGVAAGLELGVELVRPPEWKNALGLPRKADKAAGREMAARLWPQKASLFSLVKHHNRADACLIAWHGMHRIRGF